MAAKFPKLLCTRTIFHFGNEWQVVWYPDDPKDRRGSFNVTITHHHENGGDSVSYSYSGPASEHSSLHLIKTAIKENKLPK